MIRKVCYSDNVVAFCTADQTLAASDGSAGTARLVFDIGSLHEQEVENRLRWTGGVTNLRQIFETAKSVVFVAEREEEAERTFRMFARQFCIVEAAGGVVTSPEGELLIICRHGKWDLPKGKVERGEGAVAAAVREVEEECGVTGLKPGGLIARSWHVYPLEERWVLKRTSWFAMGCRGTGGLVPQTQEGITDVRWVPLDDNLKPCLENTYQTVRDVLKTAFPTFFPMLK